MNHAPKYYVPPYERQRLRIWVRQYPGWKRALALLTHTSRAQRMDLMRVPTGEPGKPTEMLAIKRTELSKKTNIIEQTARETDPLMYPYLIRGVTEKKMTYDRLRADGLAVSKNTYYDRYRKFWFLLHKKNLMLRFAAPENMSDVDLTCGGQA